jgi:uncharacterized protein (TIGR02996 family)
MTTEEDFQAALDATPEDWQTRLVFADWLEERGDPRAQAFRALGQLRRNPGRFAGSEARPYDLWCWLSQGRTGFASEEVLPDDWYALLPRTDHSAWWTAAERRTRREAEEDAVAAFTRLPAERRAELLTAPPMPLRLSPPIIRRKK